MSIAAEIQIFVESPLQEDVQALIDQLNAHILPLSPIESQFNMTATEMAEPDTTVFVARDANNLGVGVGALKRHGAEIGEVKRMFTTDKVRGQGVGAMLLDHIVSEAQRLELKTLVLETGTPEEFQSAWHLYESRGFSECGVVLDYPDSEHSKFYQKELA